MSLLVDYTISYGELEVKHYDGSGTFKVDIHPCNALCAFIVHYQDDNGKKYASLWMFLGNEQHIENIMNDGSDHTLLGTSVLNVRLNVFYEQARKLVLPMAKSGYNVTCYYEEH